MTDSRKAGEGSLFVAIPGERVDGHKFIPNVASQGALAVISEQKLETPPCPYILVKDSMEAIKAMAEYYMQQLNIPVVGITGSVGKTSTKETIASVLAQKYRVLKTDANFNNEDRAPGDCSHHEYRLVPSGKSEDARWYFTGKNRDL